jgi:hypothetical protein
MAKNWVKKLQELSMKRENLPPNYEEGDWFTVRDAQAKLKIGDNRARQIVTRGLKDGSVQAYRGSAWSVDKQQLVRQVWYKFSRPK